MRKKSQLKKLWIVSKRKLMHTKARPVLRIVFLVLKPVRKVLRWFLKHWILMILMFFVLVVFAECSFIASEIDKDFKARMSRLK